MIISSQNSCRLQKWILFHQSAFIFWCNAFFISATVTTIPKLLPSCWHFYQSLAYFVRHVRMKFNDLKRARERGECLLESSILLCYSFQKGSSETLVMCVCMWAVQVLFFCIPLIVKICIWRCRPWFSCHIHRVFTVNCHYLK